jgi:hypothetical protein
MGSFGSLPLAWKASRTTTQTVGATQRREPDVLRGDVSITGRTVPSGHGRSAGSGKVGVGLPAVMGRWQAAPKEAAGPRAGHEARLYEATIAAPIEVVWRHLITGEGLVRWVGPVATGRPTPGGALRRTHPDGATVVGRFVEVVPHRWVVSTYGWEDGRLGVPPGSTTVGSTWWSRAVPPPSAWCTTACPGTAPDHERG